MIGRVPVGEEVLFKTPIYTSPALRATPPTLGGVLLLSRFDKLLFYGFFAAHAFVHLLLGKVYKWRKLFLPSQRVVSVFAAI